MQTTVQGPWDGPTYRYRGVAQLLINLLGIGVGLSAVTVASTADSPDASTFSIGAGI